MGLFRTWYLMVAAVAIVALAASLWWWRAAGEQPGSVVVDGAVLGEIVTATDVDAYNRPLWTTAAFYSDDEAVHVVAEAIRIRPGTEIFARWARNGKPIGDSTALVTKTEYRDTSIGFWFENLGSRLQPGNYSVTLLVNHQAAATTDFVVTQRSLGLR